MSSSSHGAAASAVGYLYQARWALLEVLRTAHDRPDQSISVEKFEDVAWDRQGTPAELLQLKHHQATTGSVGDKDDDVWRTIRGWLDVGAASAADAPDLYLVTTQTAAVGSGLAALRPPDRDLVRAERLLTDAASSSTAKGTMDPRRRFLNLTDGERSRLIAKMHVLDAAPHVEDLDAQVIRELRYVLPRGHEEIFLDLLWAWWYNVVLGMLLGERASVSATTVSGRVSDLRDQFARGGLPTLARVIDTEEEPALAAQHADRPFVHQLRWVDTPGEILQTAVVDYYRAVTQTVAWVEDDLIGLHEIGDFEHRLKDEWRREMAWRRDALPSNAPEEMKIAVGKELLRTVLEQTRVRVRERYDDPFFGATDVPVGACS